MMALELHPILERDVCPSPKWWYVLSLSGESPSMRVGHSATFVPGLHADEHDRVFVIGGANPEQVFSEVYVLNLHLRSWDIMEAPGFRGRYEHAAFQVSNHSQTIFVFGGATQSGSLNDVQSLDISTGMWKNVDVVGTLPAPRTHRSAAVIGPKVYFYSGGHSGPDPVGDRRVHCLDTFTMTWTSLAPSGDSPKPRHGHIMVPMSKGIFLHGGMAGSTFYDDMFILDLDQNSWKNVKKKTFPPPRAAHEGILHNKEIYLFGGMNKAGALDDGYKFSTDNNTWTKLVCDGPAPANRLDFAMCSVKLRVPVSNPGSVQEPPLELTDASSRVLQVLEREWKHVDENQHILKDEISGQEQQASNGDVCSGTDKHMEQAVPGVKEVSLILINGGMDTAGEMFDDTLVMLL